MFFFLINVYGGIAGLFQKMVPNYMLVEKRY